jgi:hypothetical protein
LNTLLREARSELRYVSLSTSDQMASVVLAREAAIARAADSGWLRPDTSDSARAAGTAAEDQVFEELEADGDKPQRNVAIPKL